MKFVHPMAFTGSYPNDWAGYFFKQTLGYTPGRHTGVDYNFGNGNEDAGYRVYSIADGVVRYAGNPNISGFGNVVIIEHPNTTEGTLFSRYMHLGTVNCSVGQAVGVGQQVATCGSSGTQYAHLHLDLWKANLGVHMRYDKDTQLSSYLDPFTFIEAHKTYTGDVPMNRDEEANAYRIMLGREMEHNGSGRTGYKFILDGRAEVEAQRAAKDRVVADLQTALANEQAKPPKEVIREVEKIVTEYQEVIKEVPVYTHDQETKDLVIENNKRLKSLWALLLNLFKRRKS